MTPSKFLSLENNPEHWLIIHIIKTPKLVAVVRGREPALATVGGLIIDRHTGIISVLAIRGSGLHNFYSYDPQSCFSLILPCISFISDVLNAHSEKHRAKCIPSVNSFNLATTLRHIVANL